MIIAISVIKLDIQNIALIPNKFTIKPDRAGPKNIPIA